MKFKYLDTVYIIENYLRFFKPTQAWVIRGYTQEPSGEYKYCLYPEGVRKEVGPIHDIWMPESNLETHMERNVRELKEQQQQRQHTIKSQEEFYLDVLRKQELQARMMSFKELRTWPDVQPGFIVTPKEEILNPEYSYEPIFKDDKE